MKSQFIEAIKIISDESRLACAGRPMVTITFATALDEARFYERLRMSLGAEPFSAVMAITKPNVQLAVGDVPVRLTSETKIDEFVRANLK